MIISLLILYMKLIACSVIGMGFQLSQKDKSMDKTAAKANVEYPGFWGFIKQDRSRIIKTFATISLLFLVIGNAINPDNLGLKGEMDLWIFTVPKRLIYEGVLSLLFATTGYVGQDYALRAFSVTDTKIKNAIDFKTTELDTKNGTAGQRTPTT